MSIIQFFRIFWARRLIVLVTMIASALGAYVVASLVQPRYEATARVIFNLTKPDPITGDVIGGFSAQSYFDAQTELVRDYSVTGQVVDAFGWLSDPNQMSAYQSRPPADTRDFRRWLAQQIAESTDVHLNGTVMDIVYRAPTAVMARVGADTLRRGFLRASVDVRRTEAAKNAQFYSQQADNARKGAEDAETAKAAYERANGIVMDGQQMDMESERLAALATAAAAPQVQGGGGEGGSSASMQLAQIDAKIAELSTRLGPNHPEMQALRAQRAAVAKLSSQEASAHVTSSIAALNHALEQQKARVIAQRDKVERLRQLQGEVDLRREQYRTAAARAAQFSMESNAEENAAAPLGIVITPNAPVFPNKKLMVGGALALGTALGLAVALLLELLNRRVRGVEDLQISSEITCIGVVEPPRGAEARKRGFGGVDWRRMSRSEAAA